MKLFTKLSDMPQAFSKADLQLLADVMHDGSKVTLQVMQYEDFILQNYCYKCRLTLVINIEDQWHTVAVDDKYRIYVSHKRGMKEDLIKHLQGNQSFKETFKNHLSSKHVKSICMKENHGISALIIAKSLNDLIENSQIENVKVTDIGKFVTPDLREYLDNSLITYRRVLNQFKNLTKEPCDEVIAAKPAKKRGPSEPEPLAQSPAKVPKPASESARAPDSGQMTIRDKEDESSKVVIRNIDPMTEEQINSFRKCINASICLIEENGVVPRLNDLNPIPGGCLILTCEDAVSLQWLMQEIPKIDKNGMKLTILPVICNIHIPLSEVDTVEEAFSLLKRQNPGLNTELWCVLDSKRVPNSLSVSVGMDEPSAKVLCHLEWRAKLGLTYIKFILDSSYSSLAETSTVETTPEQPDMSSHNESVSCATLITHDTNADGTKRQTGSAPQVGTIEPSTTLDSSAPEGIEITKITQVEATEINTAASAASPEQAVCPQGINKFLKMKLSRHGSAPVLSVTTPSATGVERRDPGLTASSTDVRQGGQITKSGQPHRAPRCLPVSLKIPPSLRTAWTTTADHGDQSEQECSSRLTNGQVNELPRNDNEISRVRHAYLNPLKLVRTSSVQPNHYIISSHNALTNSEAAAGQLRQAEQSPTERSQKINSSRVKAHSQRSPAPTAVPGQQGCLDSQAELNHVNELTRKDDEISQERQAYLNPLNLLRSVQQNHSTSQIALSTTEAADKEPRQAVQPITGESPIETRAKQPQRAPTPAGHGQQGWSESQSEPAVVMDLSSSDNNMKRIYLEMYKMFEGSD